MANCQIKSELLHITAPAKGMVMAMQVHTKGQVLAPGATLLDVVPEEDDLIIEAKVAPDDIDIIRPGKIAQVMLSAYQIKDLPKFDAVVRTVSGDAVQDPATGETYYAARLAVDESLFKDLKKDIDLYPGMNAQVFLTDKERTLAQYLLDPITKATHMAFKEQ